MKFLIDTNILIPLEPTSPEDIKVNSVDAVRFAQLITKSNNQLYVHPIQLKDIENDNNNERKKLRAFIFCKYPILHDPPSLTPEITSLIGISSIETNDWVDDNILCAAYYNAVDYIVTEDKIIIQKAKKLDIDDRIIRLEEAISIVEKFFETPSKPPPAVEDIKPYNIRCNDKIFLDLIKDYSGFSDWLKKVQREHRQTWIINGKNELAALCIVKKENNSEYGFKGKVLKICTFKVLRSYMGYGYGELLLKTVFNYAVTNNFDNIYVTTFEKHIDLISFLVDFGFMLVSQFKTNIGEVILLKPLTFEQQDYDNLSSLEFNKRYGPYNVKISNINSFVVPIQPQYHRGLFPELELQVDFLPGLLSYGNTIKKVYLSNSKIRQIARGDNVYFYRSCDVKGLTALGVVEKVVVSSNVDRIARFVGKRTVYNYDQLKKLCKSEVIAILFRQARLFNEPIKYKELLNNDIISGPPQQIQTLAQDKTKWIAQKIL